MKLLSILATLSLSLILVIPTHAEGFSVKEYDEFHHVLHHLQHEALPKNDMATIRSKSTELIQLGQRITNLGVPQGTKAENVENSKKNWRGLISPSTNMVPTPNLEVTMSCESRI